MMHTCIYAREGYIYYKFKVQNSDYKKKMAENPFLVIT